MNDIDKTVAQVKSGHTDAYETIVRAYEPDIRAFIAYRSFSAEAVEDLTQETFVLGFLKIRTFDAAHGSFVGWLKGIARNLILQNFEQLEKTKKLNESFADKQIR